MKKNIIIAGSIFLLTSLSLGMEFEETITPFSCYPPQITIAEYSLELVCGGSIEGWGHMTGSLGVWYQQTANKRRVTDSHGNTIQNLTLLCLTPNPVVDDNRLRADYYLPAPNAQIETSPPTLSLYHEASEEMLAAASLLPRESFPSLAQRILLWQNQNYVMEVKSFFEPVSTERGINRHSLEESISEDSAFKMSFGDYLACVVIGGFILILEWIFDSISMNSAADSVAILIPG